MKPICDRMPTIKKITKNIPKLVTLEKNTMLLREITMNEIEEVIIPFPKRKFLRLCGITTSFSKILENHRRKYPKVS